MDTTLTHEGLQAIDDFIGKNAAVLLAEIGISAGPEVRQIVAEVDQNHPAVWSEQMMPIMPVVRVANADEGIDLAVEAEHGFRHTAVMHSKNLDNLSHIGIHEGLTATRHENREHAQPAAFGCHVPSCRRVGEELGLLVRIAAESIRSGACAVAPVRTQPTTCVAQRRRPELDRDRPDAKIVAAQKMAEVGAMPVGLAARIRSIPAIL